MDEMSDNEILAFSSSLEGANTIKAQESLKEAIRNYAIAKQANEGTSADG
jgi:hypothetical protein